MSVTAVLVNYHTDLDMDTVVKDLHTVSAVDSIIVVDNSGGYSNMDCEVLKPTKNIGFGAGVNLAVKQTDADWILLLNPDMRVPPGSVESLVIGAQTHGALLAGPRFFWDNNRQFKIPPALGASSWMDYALAAQSNNRLDAQHLAFYWEMRHERFWNADKPFVEPFLSGACMLVNKKWALDKHDGLFDPRFFIYFEDSDLAVLAHEDGVPPLCIPSSEMIHFYNQSPDPGISKGELMVASHEQYKAKHYPGACFDFNFKGSYEPKYIDLGKTDTSLIFKAEPCHSNEPLYFEIGVNLFFIPFTQTDFTNGSVELPKDIWNRLQKGIYFSRIRHPLKGVQKIWKWEKI